MGLSRPRSSACSSLTAALVSGVITYMRWHGNLAATWLLAAVQVFALAAAPYFGFILRNGSPTPQTPAQLALIADGVRAAGWADLPRLSFPGFVVYFSGAFVADWMPTLGVRNVFNYAVLVIPGRGARLRVRRGRRLAAPLVGSTSTARATSSTPPAPMRSPRCWPLMSITVMVATPRPDG